MSMSTAVALPTSSDPGVWTPEEKALVEAAGLVHTDAQSGQKTLAERPVVAAFLQHCARTGLDPIARQIYCLARKSKGQLKWQIQISIDGARLVAERTGQYEGQTPVQWTADGVTWVEVWLGKEPPRAARVGVYRRGFREPLYAVATWDSYVQTKYDGSVTDMWQKFGPLMLGKCAEMLALRKAFPQDLSGLYTTEEMAQAAGGEPEQPQGRAQEAKPVVAEVVEEQVDWASLISGVLDIEGLREVYRQVQHAGAMAVVLPSGETVEAAMWARQRVLTQPEPVVDVEPEPVAPRDWVREARAKRTSDAVDALWREASALGASSEVLDQLQQISASLPVSKKGEPPAGGWPEPVSEDAADAVEAELVDEAEVGRAAVLDPETEEEPF